MTQLDRSSFTTAQLPVDERFVAWRQSIGSLFDVSLPSSAPDDRFHAGLDSCLLNQQVILGHCRTSAQRFERNSLRTARDGLDYYLIQTHLSGSQELWRAGKADISSAGDLMVIDLADRHLARTTDFANLTLIIPRTLLAPLLLAPDSQQGRILKPHRPLAALAVSHIETLARVADTMTPAEAADIVEPTLKLMACALNGTVDSVEEGAGGVAMSLLAHAKLEIERNLAKNLSVDELCRSLGLSRTRLYALFESVGGIRAYIQERRLSRCAETLLSPQSSQRRIYEIAFSWGFSSESHFSRAFKQKFGMTPSEARREHFSPRHMRQPALSGQVGDRDYEEWLVQTLKY